MHYIKPISASIVAATVLAQSASAGNMAEPMIEPDVIQEETTASGGGLLIPLFLLLLLAAAASGGGGSTPVPD